MAMLLGLMVLLGAVAFVATDTQRRLFNSTASRLETQMQALVALDHALFSATEHVTAVVYGLEGGSMTRGDLAAYERASSAVDAAFADVKAVVSSDSDAILEDARESWRSVDRSVRAAAFGPEGHETMGSPAPDDDALAHMSPYGDINESLVALRERVVAELGADADAMVRVQRQIHPLVVGVLGVALTLTWLAARRITKRVVRPVQQLRDAALAIGRTEFDYELEMPHAAAELVELADVLNDTSRSLGRAHKTLRHEADTDPLTGLMNRKAFGERLGVALDEPDPHGLTLMFVDLDDFKTVNDTHGHAAGDELLRVVARRLQSSVREGDLVARLGGDEFAALVRCGDTEEAKLAAERILAGLRKPIVLDGASMAVGGSIGAAVADASMGATHADQLVQRADSAMYDAKNHGKNCIAVYSEAANATAVVGGHLGT